MPGPVSDSYDPEFGTGENARRVSEALYEVRGFLTRAIGSNKLANIVQLAYKRNGKQRSVLLSERQLRLLRFAVDRARDTL